MLPGIITMKPQRILILITQLERAGAQKAAFTLAEYLHNQAHQVTLAFLYDKEGWMAEAQANHPFPIINLRAKSSSKIRSIGHTAVALWKLRRYLRNNQIDTLFSLTPYSNILGSFVGWWAGVPVRVSSQRNVLKDTHPILLKLDAAVVNSPLTTHMTAVSNATRDFCINVEGMKPQKVSTITNGIHLTPPEKPDGILRHQLGIPAKDKICLTVARLHPQKGLTFLIDAAQKVLRLHPDTTFLIAGEGDLRAELQQQIDNRQLTGRVRLIGNRKDIPALLVLSDLFVLSSLHEGLSNALLEAMAASLPIVATDVEGVAELLTDQCTALVVPAEDSLSLAKAVSDLLEDSTKRTNLASAAHKHVADAYPVTRFCQEHEALFDRLLSMNSEKSIETKQTAAFPIPTAPILGVNVHKLTVPMLHATITQMINSRHKSLVLHVNAHAFNLISANKWLQGFWNSAEIVFCDGAGVKIGAKLLGHDIPMRITYADWMWELAAFSAENNYSLYFLGAKPGVASQAAHQLRLKYPTLQILGTVDGYFDKTPASLENQAVIKHINSLKPDILIVGFGMPVQEKWLNENWADIDATVGLTAGAVFDYVSGNLQRAPTWMTDYTMEWLGRLIIEPQRLWRRYLVGNPLFLIRIIKQRLMSRHHVKPTPFIPISKVEPREANFPLD